MKLCLLFYPHFLFFPFFQPESADHALCKTESNYTHFCLFPSFPSTFSEQIVDNSPDSDVDKYEKDEKF